MLRRKIEAWIESNTSISLPCHLFELVLIVKEEGNRLPFKIWTSSYLLKFSTPSHATTNF
jgi:hypothetical protein